MQARQRVEEGAFQLPAGAEKGRAQHDAGDPVGMRLRIASASVAPQDPPTIIQR
jgi:hypothetical protein